MTTAQAAEYLGIRPSRLRHWICEGWIDFVKCGDGLVRLKQSVLDRFVSGCAIKAKAHHGRTKESRPLEVAGPNERRRGRIVKKGKERAKRVKRHRVVIRRVSCRRAVIGSMRGSDSIVLAATARLGLTACDRPLLAWALDCRPWRFVIEFSVRSSARD
ncbi:MAG: excisionase family DNA-binding protein [Bryobacteraceae bacterium]